MSYKGRFKPKNPHKYKGDPTVCAYCNKQYSSTNGLAKHLSKTHNVKSKDYYILYLKLENENINCLSCKHISKFINLDNGFRDYCKKCSRSIGAKRMRKNLKDDVDKFKSFKIKVSNNQKKIWETREADGSDKIIRKKIGKSNSLTFSKMTQEERNEKFGWLNKLSENEKKIYIEERLSGFVNWWSDENVDKNKKIETIEKRRQTMISKTLQEKRDISKKKLATRYKMASNEIDRWYSNKEDRELYYRAVWEITEISYNYNKNKIDPYNLRGAEYSLDHIHSIFIGYLKQIDPVIIGHPSNLQMLKKNDNLSKSAECWIEIDDLLNEINIFDKNNKDSWFKELIYGL